MDDARAGSEHPGIYAYLDEHAPDIVGRLGEWVSIPSVAADPARRIEMIRSARWLAGEMRDAGLRAESFPRESRPRSSESSTSTPRRRRCSCTAITTSVMRSPRNGARPPRSPLWCAAAGSMDAVRRMPRDRWLAHLWALRAFGRPLAPAASGEREAADRGRGGDRVAAPCCAAGGALRAVRL